MTETENILRQGQCLVSLLDMTLIRESNRASTGIVNIYGATETSSTGSDKPKPLKSLGNLTTSISTLRFNPDSQLLAMASNSKKDQMRLVRVPPKLVEINQLKADLHIYLGPSPVHDQLLKLANKRDAVRSRIKCRFCS